jgi:20S proteasome alpha/beta subunit
MQAVTGIIADGRQIVNRAADEAVQYKKCAAAAALQLSMTSEST